MNHLDNEKKIAAVAAVKEISEGMTIGLGTGSTAYYAIQEIAKLVQQGMSLQAVPTSEHTHALAIELGIPLIDIHTIDTIHITIDGADEFTQNLELIKGGGGALLREKIVASMTQKQIIIADSSKMVSVLGKFKVPIEVIPFAYSYVLNQLKKIGGVGILRQKDGKTFLTDQGHYIIDTDFGFIENAAWLDEQINNMVGVVEHGLFINLTHKIIMAKNEEVVIFSEQEKAS